MELSGWWRRAAAWIIDALIISAPVTAVLWLAGFDFGEYYGEDGSFLLATREVDLVYCASYTAAATVYYLRTMIAWNGRTVGKRVLGIRAIRDDGGRMVAGTVLVREIVVILPLYFVPLLAVVNYLMPLFERHNRAGHDLIARTRVIRTRT